MNQKLINYEKRDKSKLGGNMQRTAKREEI